MPHITRSEINTNERKSKKTNEELPTINTRITGNICECLRVINQETAQRKWY